MLAWLRKLRLTTRRLSRAQGGAAAVEFALIALPFFLLLFGTIELALVFLLATSLENATDMAARQVRTGQMQTAGGASAEKFKTLVCDNLGWLQGDCSSNLYVDVRTFGSFSSVASPGPITTSGGTTTFDKTKLTFDLGVAGSIVVVRTYYTWPIITPLVTKAMQTLSNGQMVVSSVAAFRNEPYT